MLLDSLTQDDFRFTIRVDIRCVVGLNTCIVAIAQPAKTDVKIVQEASEVQLTPL